MTTLREAAELAQPMLWETEAPYSARADFRAVATPERVLELVHLAERVARLNPDAGEIGAGMLASLVADARRALGK